MKKLIVTYILIIAASSHIWAQSNDNTRIPLIGEMTPEFTAQSTTGKINFPGDYEMKWKIIFSHPADFTPVCSSELLELATMQDEFDNLNTKIMVLSTDGISSHMDEILRTLIALQTSEKYDVLTPANWIPGQKVMVESPNTEQEAEKMEKQNDKNLTSLTWYMWFRSLPLKAE